MQAPSKTALERLEKGWRLGWLRHSERADLEFRALLGARSTLCTVDVRLGMGRKYCGLHRSVPPGSQAMRRRIADQGCRGKNGCCDG